MEVLGDRTRVAHTDRAGVALDDRDDLGRGAGEEALVGGVNVVAVHRALDHRDPRLPRQFDHRFAG